MSHYTNIEQSKKLLELGLNPESADMKYRWCICKEQDGEALEDWLCELGKPFDECPDECIPCWSVGTLLEVLPNHIFKENHFFTLSITCDDVSGLYYLTYKDKYGRNTFPTISDKSILEVVYNMTVWLLENNYIKKGE